MFSVERIYNIFMEEITFLISCYSPSFFMEFITLKQIIFNLLYNDIIGY